MSSNFNNLNSSALSDDGKLSTRALRGFGTSDFDYIAEREAPKARGGNDGDVMGLSTQVEISDRGSRRNAARREDEMIEEVDDDESGRTGPPGTIGERTIGEHHEYMSENIESNVI